MRRIIAPALVLLLVLVGAGAGWLGFLSTMDYEARVRIDRATAFTVLADASAEVKLGNGYLIGPARTDGTNDRVDFDTLLSSSKDAAAYLYIPGTSISAPVMQEFDGSLEEPYYLWRDIYGNRSDFGCLFMPKYPDGLDDPHKIIFGHNMESGTIGFSQLKQLYGTGAGMDMNGRIYMYYPDRSEMWTVWAVCETDASDPVYYLSYPRGSSDYAGLIQHMREIAVSVNGAGPGADDDMLVLSTCGGGAGTDKRFLVAAVKAETFTYGAAAALGSFDGVVDVSTGAVMPDG